MDTGTYFPRLGAQTGRAVLDNFGIEDGAATLFVESQTLSRGATSESATAEGRLEFRSAAPERWQGRAPPEVASSGEGRPQETASKPEARHRDAGVGRKLKTQNCFVRGRGC